MNFRAATTESAQPEAKAKRSMQGVVPLVIIVLALLSAGTAVVAYAGSVGGPTHYACMALTSSGGTVTVTTTGLTHLVSNEYYISCNEGSSLPSNVFKMSCLTISPETIPAKIGVGASTEYYYFSSSGGQAIHLNGATLTNGEEDINPAGISLTVSC